VFTACFIKGAKLFEANFADLFAFFGVRKNYRLKFLLKMKLSLPALWIGIWSRSFGIKVGISSENCASSLP
jgi:hypothetical protein